MHPLRLRFETNAKVAPQSRKGIHAWRDQHILSNKPRLTSARLGAVRTRGISVTGKEQEKGWLLGETACGRAKNAEDVTDCMTAVHGLPYSVRRVA